MNTRIHIANNASAEFAFKECAKNVKIEANSFEDHTVVWRPWNGIKLSALLSKHPYSDFRTAASAQPLSHYKTVLDVTQVVSDAMVAKRLKYDETMKTMEEKNLGFYTSEQEADDIGAEILAKIGMAPEAMVEMEYKFFEIAAKADPRGAQSLAECRALQAAKWNDANGKPVRVPLGTLTDLHHSQCYRIFNLEREFRAHRYQVATNVTHPPAAEWSDLQARARSETPASSGTGPWTPGGAAIRRSLRTSNPR